MQKEIGSECPGFEIISQSSNKLEIEDLTDIKEIKIEKIISRLRSLVLQQFVEVKSGNNDAVMGIEELADRFYMLGIRYVNIVQPKDVIKYYRTVAALEDNHR